MNRFSVKCPECTYPLDAAAYNQTADYQECGSCKAKFTVFALPALYRKRKTFKGAMAAELDEAACYYHAEKKADQVCDDCGRFLCSLCTLPLENETVCASCLEGRRKQASGQHQLKPRQMRFDKLAFGLAVFPLLYFPLTIFTAPAALFISIRYWNKELEFAPSMRFRMSISMSIALLEITGWVALTLYLIREMANG